MSTRVCLTFDIDAQFVWLGTFGTRGLQGWSRGEYEVRVGLPRVLSLLRERALPATFFVTGRFAETYPQLVREIAAAGHEVGAHGYNHERWPELSREAEVAVIQRSKAAIAECLGRAPHGFRAPGFELNPWSIRLIEEAGFAYDSSLMGDDFRPYHPASEAVISDAGPLSAGKPAGIMEFPVSWELDDFPYFAHTNRNPALRSPLEVQRAWLEEYEVAVSIPDAVYTLTLHPQVIGRGPRLAMLAGLIEHMRSTAEPVFSTLGASLATIIGEQPARDHRL